MAKVSVRYIVDDVDAAIDFYCRKLGFHEDIEDPAGNPIELVEPIAPKAKLEPGR